jgi:GNAT superfamily N-acetyltransferase
MDFDHILQRLDHERRYLARDGEVLHVLPHLTRTILGKLTMVSWSHLNEANAEEVIAGELAHPRAENSSFEWKFYIHDNPPDLLARLQQHDLKAGPTEAVMIYDLVAGPPPCPAGNCTVRKITHPNQIDHYRRVAEEALGQDYSRISGYLLEGLQRNSTDHVGYISYVNNEPVSIGRLYTHPLSAFGGLYGGITREAYRGRGFYRAIIAARAADAIELGARYLLVDALPTSRPILERLGFHRLTETIPCELLP